jgi:hypothetical protein
MIARDVLYNDLIRQYLKEQGVGFPADLSVFLGDNLLLPPLT